jgi:hypothetical protein
MLYCTLFNASSAAGASWTRYLGDGEKASVLAVGEEWVAVVTDANLIR